MRTDSINISKDAIKDIEKEIVKCYGKNILVIILLRQKQKRSRST